MLTANLLFAEDRIHSEVLDLLTATPEELTRELSQRVMKRLDDRLKGTSDADPVRLGIQGYRARLYEQRFGATPGVCQSSMVQLNEAAQRRQLMQRDAACEVRLDGGGVLS